MDLKAADTRFPTDGAPKGGIERRRGDRPGAAAGRIAVRRQRSPDRPFHALLLDPNHRLLETLGKLFEALGIRTTLANSGAGAARLARLGRFDLWVVDLELLLFGGGGLLGDLRSQTHATRIIVTSAWCPYEVHGLRVAGWGDEWLFKPFGLTELTASLRRLGLRCDGRQGGVQ